MRKDKAARTKMIRRYNRMFLISLVAILIGFTWLGIGTAQYQSMVDHSSSPIGTQLLFKRSNAQTKITGIYTDRERNVLIVRISPDAGSGIKLPFKGSDYKVYLASKSLNGYVGKEVPILFGRYSTNGDLFLVIPKPTDDVYNIFVMNKNYVATDDLVTNDVNKKTTSRTQTRGTAQTKTVTDNLSEDEIQANLRTAMNNFDYTNKQNGNKAVTIESDLMDVVGFRATLKPAFDDDAYRVEVIDDTLLDDNGNFDFKKFYEHVFKGAATGSIEEQYNELNSQKELLTKRINDVNSRLKENPNDEDAKKKLSDTQKSLDTLNTQLSDLANKYNEFKSTDYDESLFKNMQTKAMVLNNSATSQLNNSKK